MECREVVDSIKEAPKCIECELLQQQFQEERKMVRKVNER